MQLFDVSRSRVVRQITPSELNQLAAQGQIGWFMRRGRTHACMQPLPMQSRTSNPLHSKLPLVSTDSELNAEGSFSEKKGIVGVRKFGLNRFGATDENIVGNRIDQSMSKVEAWPFVYDERNVSICAGVVHGATEVQI